MNKVILVGRLTRDPELRNTPSGKSVASASLATSENYVDKNGQKQQLSEFHNLVIWGKSGEAISKYCQKGSKLLVEGKLTTETFTGQDGVKKYTTKIVVSNFEFLDSKPQEPKPAPAPSYEDDIQMPVDDDDFNVPVSAYGEEPDEEIRVENIPF